ncbi:MAG: PQ-loop repeat-containing protein [Candidatus Aenigmarchaeota archaeon]|nr:PQ-loop repeat-containing protein [Candidatus Aenigmarchaeota archaeon]
MVWETVGFLGGLLLALALVPQLLKTWKTKSAKDLSLLWTSIALMGLILYAVYAAKNAVIPLLIFSTIEAIMIATLIILKILYDRVKRI